jgi:hypothetical protein
VALAFWAHGVTHLAPLFSLSPPSSWADFAPPRPSRNPYARGFPSLFPSPFFSLLTRPTRDLPSRGPADSCRGPARPLRTGPTGKPRPGVPNHLHAPAAVAAVPTTPESKEKRPPLSPTQPKAPLSLDTAQGKPNRRLELPGDLTGGGRGKPTPPPSSFLLPSLASLASGPLASPAARRTAPARAASSRPRHGAAPHGSPGLACPQLGACAPSWRGSPHPGTVRPTAWRSRGTCCVAQP